MLTLSKNLDFMFFQKNSFLREFITKMTKISGQKKGFSGKPHSVSERAEDGLSSYHKISIFDFLTKIDFFFEEDEGR